VADGPGLVAIIPARGGSKGIRRKNVVDVAGKPLIGWTIEACKCARRIERCIVSTDDAEVAEVAAGYGIDTVRRPRDLAGDASPVEGALLHALDAIESDGVALPERFAFLQCTSPLTLPEDIDGAIEAGERADADVVVSVTDFHYFLWSEQPDGSLVGLNHDHRVRPMRQDRPGQLLEAGSVYVIRTQGFREARHRFFGRIVPHRVPSDRVFEIDDPEDLAYAAHALASRRAAAS